MKQESNFQIQLGDSEALIDLYSNNEYGLAHRSPLSESFRRAALEAITMTIASYDTSARGENFDGRAAYNIWQEKHRILAAEYRKELAELLDGKNFQFGFAPNNGLIMGVYVGGKITGSELAELLGHPASKIIRQLLLEGVVFDRKGMAQFAETAELNRIRYILVQQGEFGAEELDILVKSPNLTSLRELEVSGNMDYFDIEERLKPLRKRGAKPRSAGATPVIMTD
ncbi:MAG: hypothetical protein OEY44_01695 [Candidatus Peregrinibacteria bacterium]|nr:hypothetical protein [Candidatus Peregrinibacteria bacterium]